MITFTLGQIGLFWFSSGIAAYLVGDFLFTGKNVKQKEPVWTRFYEEDTFWYFLAKGPFSFITVYEVWKSLK